MSRHDAGLYSCIASNIIGEGDRVDIEIDVHCKFETDILSLYPCSVSVSHDPADFIVSLCPGCCCCHQHHQGPRGQ